VKQKSIFWAGLLLSFALLLFSCGNSKRASKKKKKKKAKTEIRSQNHADKDALKTTNANTGNDSKKPDARAEKVIQTAKSYIGTPYKYGGTSRAGMDCSGLVVTAFKSAGIELPRTSKEQSQRGKPIEKKDVMPGDLVFFSRSFNKEVSHAGIVVEASPGQAKFIHASSSKGVRIDDLYGEYWSKLFLLARRIF
jgi:cell wall-associated NlpC family hydrolase